MNPEILVQIEKERAYQDAKWGPNRNHSDFVWLAIMTEELGEAAEGILENEFNDDLAPGGHVEEEVLHAVAVGVAWLEAIQRREE